MTDLELIEENKRTKATFLDLGNCGLYNLPPELLDCTWLENLNLGVWYYDEENQAHKQSKNQGESNQITYLIGIEKLVKLRILSFSDNRVIDISPLQALFNLQTLNFYGNQVTDISSLQALSNLQTLDFYGNQVTDISALQELVNLQTLNFYGNQVSNISPLQALSNLQDLSFDYNQISDISSLRSLTNLRYLNFRSNQVTDISFLRSLTNLQILCANSNPILDIPKGTIGAGNCLPALKNYFQSIANKDFQKELNEAKLIIVGVGEVGKSELVDALSQPNYVFVAGRNTTKGMDIKPWTLKDCQKKEKTIDFQANIWDFAGQEINYGIHQFFLTKNSVYVFVWETRKGAEESNQFAYWLSVISLLSENSPVFVVQNRTDIYASEINQADWKSKFPNIVGFYQTSCKNGNGIEKLRGDIKSQLLALPHTFEIWNKDRYDIREFLKQSKENYISHKAYLKICKEKQLNKEQAGFLSQQLHDIGIILHYPTDIALKDTVVLKPEWATQAAYHLLLENELENKYVINGKFSTTDLEKIWAEEQFDEKHAFLLGLMKKFELIFQFQESETYIVPERLPMKQPEYQAFEKFDTLKHLRFEYHYDFMPKGIISRFICRMHELIKDKLFWKYGVVLKYENSEAVIISSEINKQISIKVVGKEADKLLAMVRWNFEAIHEKLKVNSPNLTEKVPCICPDNCEFKDKPYLHDYQTLKNFQAKGKKTRECGKSTEDIEIATLLEGILGTKKVNQENLLDLIDENKIHEFYQELDRLGISTSETNGHRQKFIHNGSTFESPDQLKVWVGSYFKQGRSF